MLKLSQIAKSLVGWLPVVAVIRGPSICEPQCHGHRQGARRAGRHTVSGESFAGLQSLPKPAIVYFWASWCGICKAMQSTVLSLAGDTPMITVAMQSGDVVTVRDYMIGRPFHVPTLVDADGSVARTYGVRGVPATFVLDREGSIRFATTGYTSELGLRLRLWWASR